VVTLTLADVCRENGLLMMNYAAGSFYLKTKAMVEEFFVEYENVCTP